MSQSVVITGAGGLIGSEVTHRLLERGYKVYPTARRGCEKIGEELNTEVITLDLLEPTSTIKTAIDLGADVLIHCATPNDILSRHDDGGMQLAVPGTYKLLEAAHSVGIRRVIYLSTLQVYGTELSGTINESSAPHCQTAYGLNHYLGEEVCRLACERYAMDAICLRPSNVYGVPRVSSVNRNTLVPTCFVMDAVQKGEIVLRSPGLQMRNFISTSEVAETMIRTLDKAHSGFSLLNAVSQLYMSIRDVAHLVAEEWRIITGTEIAVTVPDDGIIPKSTGFEVTSLHIPAAGSIEKSKIQLKSTIQELIHQQNREV